MSYSIGRSTPCRSQRRTAATRVLLILGVLAIGASGSAAEAELSEGPASTRVRVHLDASWDSLSAPAGKATIEDFPLQPGLKVDLALERFRVTNHQTRFVVGQGPDREEALAFDPDSVLLLRGRVVGDPDSRVFMALSDHGGFGTIDRATERFWISSTQPDRLEITPLTPAGGLPFGVPLCGVGDAHDPVSAPMVSPPRKGLPPIRGLRQIELAVETDYELFQLFGDLDAAGAYVVSVFAAVSEIYVRDVGARVDLSFVRLWDDPNDLFNDPDPLSSFRSYWELNMGAVERDVAQFFTGRRDLPYGGIANSSGLCNSQGYSVAGYATGFFGDAQGPHVFNRDITVTAHELGHNSSAPHTHTIGIDTCDDENAPPQRGSIMSYCGQTYTGGAANTDLRLHTGIQNLIENFIASSTCLAADCNQNGEDDAADIAGGVSSDINLNSIPDECEDCNGNSVLDPLDISGGASTDLNANGLPDECEADCNANSVPDDLDIANATSADLYGDGVPDECDADCNANTISDYREIQLDMSQDINRNAVLDACEDCDGDDTPDLVALDHAHNLWLTSLDHTRAREYLANVGPLASVSDDVGIAEGQDLLITADRRMLISSRLDNRVVELTVSGTLVGDLVSAGAGGLSEPAGLLWTDDGRLLVASRGSHAVLAFDGATGAPLGAFIAAGSGGLTAPFGLTFGPVSGNLFVTSNDNRVLEYDGATGAFVGELVSTADNGGLTEPRGLLFLPSGNLLVASYDTNQILEFDGATGAFVRQFNRGGTADRLTLDQPWSLRLGPDGGVYVSRTHDHVLRPGPPAPLHLTNARIYHFDAATGFLMRAYVLGVNSGVEHPTGFDFVPGDAIDCNRNLVPDSCDIASGTSMDIDGNGVPDSCQDGTGLIFSDGFESGDTSAW